MFVDKAEITVRGGKGGNGAVSFHREKFIAAGGPDGGDGGDGGSVIIRSDNNMSTLMDFKYKREYGAGNGTDGGGGNKKGKDGKDIIIRVPEGTLIRDKESNAIIADMSALSGNSTADEFVLAKGGRGGWGNKHFATPTRQAPRFAKPGQHGEELCVILELKLLADIGLVGYPSVGKSTLLSVVSKANPKIADYHFTTLFPNLGVVYADESVSFIMADIPGLIEGASGGAGLGHDFLRHIDRCRLIIHMVDVSGFEGRDPCKDFDIINKELASYSHGLAEREQLVAANKIDIAQSKENTEMFIKYVNEKGYEVFCISAATGAGVKELIKKAASILKNLPPIKCYEPDYIPRQNIKGSPDELVYKQYDDVWVIEGDWIERLVAGVNLSDYESRMFFDRVLRTQGIFQRLEEMGIQDGDTLSICNLEFEYTL